MPRGLRQAICGARPANVKSASKSVILALVGIAIERGLIPGVHEPIATYLPRGADGDRSRDADDHRRDLLTMRSASLARAAVATPP